jgi:hypothetical protein
VDALQRNFGIRPAAATLALAERIRNGELDRHPAEADPSLLKPLVAELARAQAHIAALRRDLAALTESQGR